MVIMEGAPMLYRNPNESIEARVEDLIGRMTLEEKIGQMMMMGRVKPKEDDSIGPLIVGGANAGRGPYEEAAPVEKWAEMADKWQEAALRSRLGIPLLLGVDAIHGHNRAYRTTIFPHNVGLGATRDEDLMRRIGEATAKELRASGLNYTFAPCVAVAKDLRWKRCYESYSEETEVVGKMTSIITGLQGSPPEGYPKNYPFVARGGNNVVACAKHFVGDGGTEGGKTDGDTKMDEEMLERDHVAPYLDCISKNVCTIMASFSSYNGEKMHAHKYLLTDVLKGKLKFKGLVISDWRGVDKLHKLKEGEEVDYHACADLAINAGIDMVLGPNPEKFQRALLSLVNETKVVPESRIDDAVRRILRVKFAAGIFDLPISERPSPDVVYCELHREIAREAVRKSLVLLKNGKNKPFLPLSKDAEKILVAGNHANNLGYQCGAWTIFETGDYADRKNGITILEATKEAVGPATEVEFEMYPSSNTLSAAEKFKYAIIAVGERPYAEYTPTYLKTEPLLQPNVVDMICSVADKVPTLLILISGRPIELEKKMLDKVEGVVAAWLPGTEGNGITDVIFGDHDFEGRLPFAWFESVNQLPKDPEAKSYNPDRFPFGHILTYNKKRTDPEGDMDNGGPSSKRPWK
ncbi:hypothetical protein SAY86_030660 [Trapa natans]|uniref:Beta-glucosidase n=1 Tax=Trapa natans TaxID=22666 RepID=A0AAN7RAU0_TRANT|nr:hypothetical protein SAY86_030660 [Trapa natans]